MKIVYINTIKNVYINSKYNILIYSRSFLSYMIMLHLIKHTFEFLVNILSARIDM